MCCLTKQGDILVALEKEIRLLHNWKEESVLPRIEDDNINNRYNDGKCDAKGRLWIGTMNKQSQRGEAAFYCIQPSGNMNKVFDHVTISNGIAWSPDNKYLYYVDTPSGFLWRFDFNLETGTLDNKIALIDYREEKGVFDGITVDEQGTIWACHWGGFQVSRWDPNSGKKIDHIELPVPNVTCCCFGGSNMNQLYITTGIGVDKTIKTNYPESGSLYICEADVFGLPANRFGI